MFLSYFLPLHLIFLTLIFISQILYFLLSEGTFSLSFKKVFSCFPALFASCVSLSSLLVLNYGDCLWSYIYWFMFWSRQRGLSKYLRIFWWGQPLRFKNEEITNCCKVCLGGGGGLPLVGLSCQNVLLNFQLTVFNGLFTWAHNGTF